MVAGQLTVRDLDSHVGPCGPSYFPPFFRTSLTADCGLRSVSLQASAYSVRNDSMFAGFFRSFGNL